MKRRREAAEAVEGEQPRAAGVKRKAEAPEEEEHLSFGKIEVDSGALIYCDPSHRAQYDSPICVRQDEKVKNI